MREAIAVTGHIGADEIAQIETAKQVEIWPERDVADVVIRVKGSDIEGVRVGSTEGGRTLVQLILRNGAAVETVLRTTADPEGLKAYHDPILNRVRQEATAKKILL